MFKVLFFVSLLGLLQLNGQSPVAQFALDNSGCLNQSIVFKNQSTNATSYIWDFCFDDLNAVNKLVNQAVVVGSATTPSGISFFKENENWYGFVSSRDDNKLFRLDFGVSLENT